MSIDVSLHDPDMCCQLQAIQPRGTAEDMQSDAATVAVGSGFHDIGIEKDNDSVRKADGADDIKVEFCCKRPSSGVLP